MSSKDAAPVVDTFASDHTKTEGSSVREAGGEPVRVFYSYSHKDDEFRIALDNHLRLLQRQGLISAWHDRRLEAGSEWGQQIDSHLRSADIILLLVSSDFLASDYCFDVELQCALDRHRDGEATVIPIILRHVDWSQAPFAELQALPRNGKAVSSWPDRDEALTNVARGVREAAQKQAARRKQRIEKQTPQNSIPAAGTSKPSGKRKWIVAAMLLLVGAGSLTFWLSNRPSTLPGDITVENQLERGKYLYREKNYTAASNLFRQAAENGSAEAADSLGVLYEFGLGMPPDCKEAKKWFQRGAKENNSSAMDHLGMLFEHGCGVKLDNEQAKHWFEKSSSLGNADAMNNLGWMYTSNLGVATDYQRAMKYFQEAADRQNGDAMNNIGWLYQNGWGVPAPDLKEAVRWFRKAAAAKSTLGMNSLGWVYETGLGLPTRDYKQALQWFKRAADAGASLGSSWAMNNIGDMYEKGYAGLANTDEAIKWYKKAAENGFELAKSNLERLGIKLREDRPCCPVTLNS